MKRIVINLSNGGVSSVSGLPNDCEIELRDFDVPSDYDGPDLVVTAKDVYQSIVVSKNGDLRC